MEYNLRNTNEVPTPTPAKESKSFTFTEEQISKQLVDMREQTDFMKRFRCALGIALREIKTLRTASENESYDQASVHSSNTPCVLPTLENSDGKSSINSDRHQSVCGDFANSDLRILKDYLNKIDLKEEERKSQVTHHPKISNLEKTTDGSKILIERSIQHIERLKGIVENRNALVKKLCQQLSLARLIRVKRETKLEEKLQEVTALKERNNKMRRSYEKQVMITRSLRAALNSQKHKVQSSENMARGLEQTRKAFDSLKSQAGDLMKSLSDKDREIAELSARLADFEKNAAHNTRDGSQESLSEVHNHSNTRECANCQRNTKELESIKMNYRRLFDDFAYYRRNHPHSTTEPTSPSRDYAQTHPYGRRRMHAQYTSPESYRRVSRPPLRRRINYGSHFSNESPGTRSSNGHMGDILLSPIEEFSENPDEAGQDIPAGGNRQKFDPPSDHIYQHNEFQSNIERIPSDLQPSPTVDVNIAFSPRFDSANNYQHNVPDLLKNPHQGDGSMPEIIQPQKRAHPSYLELGSSSSPSLSTSSKYGTEPDVPLRMNSFIRREEADDFGKSSINLDGISDLPEAPQPSPSPEPFQHTFGVLWHPALKERANNIPTTPETTNDGIQLEKLDIAQNPARIQLFGSDSSATTESPVPGIDTTRSRSHCVTYKGHEIDVTNFSMHEFRDILWSLDGGQESANAFIKFLASTARKLNASPKWAGKHTMGNPDDWLELRGLF